MAVKKSKRGPASATSLPRFYQGPRGALQALGDHQPLTTLLLSRLRATKSRLHYQDWFFIRAAAVARKIYLKPIGIGQLSRTFGGKARRGTRTNVFKKSCRGIIRQCIAQLKEADMVEPHRNGGWKITEEGQKALDTIAVAVRYPDEHLHGVSYVVRI